MCFDAHSLSYQWHTLCCGVVCGSTGVVRGVMQAVPGLAFVSCSPRRHSVTQPVMLLKFCRFTCLVKLDTVAQVTTLTP